MIEKEKNNHLPIINDTKNGKFREKLKHIASLIIEIENKKSKDLKKQSKNLKTMKTATLKHIDRKTFFV